MKRHLAYLKYVLRHKWFVFIACLKCDAGFWRGLVHDWHKFLPSEWGPYAYTFYNTDDTKRYEECQAFANAWNFHQKRGKHHWQYWLLTWDRGVTEPVDMPTKYIKEMVADWWGAGRAITGNWDAPSWYAKNKDKMIMKPATRGITEMLLRVTEFKFETPSTLAKRRAILGC